jgi:hypothetical protein
VEAAAEAVAAVEMAVAALAKAPAATAAGMLAEMVQVTAAEIPEADAVPTAAANSSPHVPKARVPRRAVVRAVKAVVLSSSHPQALPMKAALRVHLPRNPIRCAPTLT